MTARELFSKPWNEVKTHFRSLSNLPIEKQRNLGLDINAIFDMSGKTFNTYPRIIKKPGEMIEYVGYGRYYIIFNHNVKGFYNCVRIEFLSIESVDIKWYVCEAKTGVVKVINDPNRAF
jgi:hypothetical protein